MTTIRLSNSDLRKMISEAVARLMESDEWFDYNTLCRFPYFVSVTFSEHAIERGNEREITEDEVIEDLRAVIKDVISDFYAGKFKDTDYSFRVINQETCIVTAASFRLSHNGRRIKTVRVITSYIWDGRINIDNGVHYYINEPSERYLEIKQWNEENQDAVRGYAEWKKGSDIQAQRKKADKEYYFKSLNHPNTPGHEKVMQRLQKAYDSKEALERNAREQALPPGDLDAIKQHFLHFHDTQLSSPESLNRELYYDDLMQMMKDEKKRERKERKLGDFKGV